MEDLNLSSTVNDNKRSWFWKYFEIDAVGIKICKVCAEAGKNRRYAKSTGNSTLIKHAQKHSQIADNGNPNEFEDVVVFPEHKKKEANNRLVRMVIDNKESFSLVENDSFISFCYSLNPAYNLPSRRTLCNQIKTEYGLAFEKILKILNETEGRLSVTGDGWSTKTKKGFFVITVHWISPNWILQSATLEFTHFPYPHDADNTAALIIMAFKKYKIERKLFAFTSDNASEMISAMKKIKEILNLEFDADLYYNWHIRCICHIMNLSVQDALKLLNEVFAILREILKWIRFSGRLREKFREIQISKGRKEIYQLPSLDVSNRWNSSYVLIQKCYDLKDIFNALTTSENNENKIDDEQWEEMKSLANFLEIAFKFTKCASGQHYATISIQPLVYDLLIDHCDKAISGTLNSVESTTQIIEAAKSMKLKIMKYETNLCGFLPRLGLTLDPRVSSNHPRSLTKAELRNFLIKKYNYNNPEIPTDSASTSSSGIQFIFVEARKLSENSIVNRDEVDDFFLLTEKGDENCEDPLKWWSIIGCNKFPFISCAARDCLAVMASSVPSESEFSISSGYVTPTRIQMSDELFENQVKLHSWLKVLDNPEFNK